MAIVSVQYARQQPPEVWGSATPTWQNCSIRISTALGLKAEHPTKRIILKPQDLMLFALEYLPGF